MPRPPKILSSSACMYSWLLDLLDVIGQKKAYDLNNKGKIRAYHRNKIFRYANFSLIIWEHIDGPGGRESI